MTDHFCRHGINLEFNCPSCSHAAREAIPTASSLPTILEAARDFSFKTFGAPTQRQPIEDPTAGVRAHLAQELDEVEAAPHDIEEWIDVAILAFDGAFRAGYSPEAIATAFVGKYHKNMNRKWADWREVGAGAPVNHVKEEPDADRE